jgi:hypothetical protein
MKKLLTHFTLLAVAFGYTTFAFAASPVVDGTVNTGEYMQSYVNGSQTQYMSWDDTYLYIAVNGSGWNNTTDAVTYYFDFTGNTPVNQGSGTINDIAYDNVTPYFMPFAADACVYVKSGYAELKKGNTWGTNSTSLITKATNGTTSIEFRIAWTDLNGSKPTAFNHFGFISYSGSGGGTFCNVPFYNAVNDNQQVFYYCSVTNTANTGGTLPYSQVSFCQHNEGSYDMNFAGNPEFYDVTINAPALSGNNDRNFNGTLIADYSGGPNRVRVKQSFKIKNQLYVGPSSALFNDDGVSNTPTLTFSGNANKLIMAGRIDCNKDVVDNATGALQMLKIVIEHRLEFKNPSAKTALCRLSDITVNADALLTTMAGTNDKGIELQYGALTNNGAIDMYDNSTNYVNLNTRGTINADNAVRNTYVFAGTGTWELNRLLVGNQNSKLMPNSTQVITMHLKGNLEVYRHLQCENGAGQLNFIFDGADGDQSIVADVNQTYDVGFGQPAIWFKHLTINKAVGDVLIAHCGAGCGYFGSFPSGAADKNGIYVSGALTLTKGRIITRTTGTTGITSATSTTNRFHYFGLTNGATSSGESDASYIDGPMIKFGKDDYIFPVGKNNQIAKCGIAGLSSTTSHFTAEYFNYGVGSVAIDPANASTLKQVGDNEFWGIERTGGSDAVQVSLYWEPGKLTPISKLNEVKLIHYDGTNWDDQNPTILANVASNPYLCGGATISAGCITSAAIQSSFSPFTFGGASPTTLPVKLLDFSATRREKTAFLQWATATELNNNYFEIERSANGSDFVQIAQIKGNGTTNVQQNYSYTDTRPAVGTNYYRLRQIDFDGNMSYSPTVSITFDVPNGGIILSPNPAREQLVVTLDENNRTGNTTVTLLNVMGQTVATATIGSETTQTIIPLAQLARGAYFVRVQSGTYANVQRLIIE